MQTFEYKIKDPVGLHARPAGLLVQCAQACTSTVSISVNGKTADAKRLFAVMGLGVKQNDNVTFKVEGVSEVADAAKVKSFCQANI